ncbi:DNA topoisomerase 2-binding protein 1-A [Geodia barretti]|uniref:DNA topoisomerase 2-binding protein 1-A n=1 Tax=Geodia barretti TaxID=519541 RepID=A0AA35REL0_GEOBA|nr:DNA topoisomerase 2-binding protein 1-A [Geodia barretti]
MPSQRKAKTPPKFMLSALDAREKLDYGALIQELGGEYIEVEYYTNACTHLIIGKASRTEKFLGACAAGKWVLHKSYMEACRAERRFIEEEGYEWGVNTKESGLQPLDSAPRRWRVALDSAENGSSFTHHSSVLLYCERSKTAGLRRLLEAGGATVFTNTAKLSEGELRQVSHAFVSNAFIGNSHWPKDSLSLEELVQSGVACLKPEYIAEYLSKGDEVPLELYFVKEAKQLEKRS